MPESDNAFFAQWKYLTNAWKWCFFSALNMKTTFAPTLKHAQTNGQMSIWTRVGCRLGIVGTNF